MEMIELLELPAYRHMLLNHVPIIGLFMAFVVLLTGLVVRQNALLFTGLALVALTSGCSYLVILYGDAAYPAIYDQLDGHGRDWLDYHGELAETWAPLLYANAALAVVAIVLSAARPNTRRIASLLVLLVTVASLAGTSLIARSGGKIQHPEFRLTDPPSSTKTTR
jgi:hypothetical protein